MKQSQHGFSLVEALYIVLIAAVISFIGWFVWSARQSPVTEHGTTDNTNQTTTETLKYYQNDTISLRFSYPESWSVKEDLSDVRGLGNEGVITVSSPRGFAVYINLNFGGKGGACTDDPTDKPGNTLSCSTLEVMRKEQVALKSDTQGEEDVYFVEAKNTGSRVNNLPPSPTYNMYLTNNLNIIQASSPLIGTWADLGVVSNMKKLNIETHVEAANLTDPRTLQSQDAIAAKDILRSITQ